jgi:uncharacterized protein (DUF1499 family)
MALTSFADIEVRRSVPTSLTLSVAPGVRMASPSVGPTAALALAGAALCLLMLAPLGCRLEWWQYGFGLYRLMPASALLATGAVMLSVATLAGGWSRLRRRSRAGLLAALGIGAALVYVPAQYALRRSILPRIHDIATDPDNPPKFSAVLAARSNQHASSVDERRPEVVQLQKAAYPDVVPLYSSLSREKAFDEALKLAKSMPGWSIVAVDGKAGHIEASEQSRWFRFIDDIVIRVVGAEVGSRIDMRSTSRQGTSDYGVNAARIRAYMGELSARIGSSAATPPSAGN